MRHRRGQQPKRCYKHCHHNRTQPKDGAFDGGILDRVASGPALIDVLEHNAAGLNRHTEERQEPDSRGNAEMSASDKQRQQTTDAGHGDRR